MKRLDYLLIFIIVSLILIGVVMIYSSSTAFSYIKYKDNYYMLKKQLFHVLFAIFVFFFLSIIDYRAYQKFSKIFIILSMIILFLTLLFPYIPNMSKRWIKIATISFQPAEFAKLAVIIYLSWFLSKYNHLIRKNMLWVLYSLILPAITIFFILKQPHYGMAVIIFFTCIFLLFIAGAKILHILPIIGISIILSIILISNIDYMKRRIKGYLNPWKDSRDTGYQTVQSIICLGSGGLFGKGLGEGEGKLLHLPIPYSDSIFAIIGEEGGFIASCLILGLFLLYFLVGIKIAKFCIDNFGFFLTMGFICIITLQVIFNISVLTGLLPVTGLPLPFVSFGGSCLLASVAQTAILVNIYKVNKFIRDKKNTEI